jgi:bifunctional lysine-specific demethylase and histidyl-hydroxylase NO66
MPTTTPPTPTTTPPTPDPLARLDGGLSRCVGDLGSFLTDSFARQPHRWHGGSYDDLLSLADVDRLLTGSGLRRPAVRLVHDGEVIDPKSWTRRARTGAVWVDDLLHPGRVLDHFAAGATVALQGLHRWWPPLAAFCRRLELELGHPVQANAYLTPGGAAGLAPHHDTHDVFVLQVHGRKSWVVRQPVLDAPLSRQRSDHDRAGRQPVLFETDLSPGDCLYLPRGYVHSARSQQGASLHLTIGVLATTAHDLLCRLVDAAADEPAFRRTLPAGFGTDADVAAEAVKAVTGEWIAWLEHLDPGPVAAEAVQRFAANRPPLLGGQLLALADPAEVADDSTVRLRAGTTWHLEADGNAAVLAVGDRRLVLPAALEPVLRLLLDGSTHRVAALDDLLDEPSRAVLVRRLVREGVLSLEGGG